MTAVDNAMQNYIQEPQPTVAIYDIQQALPFSGAMQQQQQQQTHSQRAATVCNQWRKSDHSADHNTKEFENDHVQFAKLDGDESDTARSPTPPSTLEDPRGPNKGHHHDEQRQESITSSSVSLLRQQLQEWEAHKGLSAHENRVSCGNQHDHINLAAQTPSETLTSKSNASLLSKSFETTRSSGHHSNNNKKYTPLRHMASQPDLAARPVTQVTPYTAHADKSIGASTTESPYIPIPLNKTNTCIAPSKEDITKATEPTPVVSSAPIPPSSSSGNIAIAANAQPHNLSRTQHKLLLQRQYVFAADRNYLAHPTNMLRLTKEMDRVNREYHQVRKFEDPMKESLRRVAQRLADSKHDVAAAAAASHHAERLSRCSSTSSLSSASSSSTPETTTKGTEYLKKLYDIPWRNCQERVHQEYGGSKKDHAKSFINIK